MACWLDPTAAPEGEGGGQCTSQAVKRTGWAFKILLVLLVTEPASLKEGEAPVNLGRQDQACQGKQSPGNRVAPTFLLRVGVKSSVSHRDSTRKPILPKLEHAGFYVPRIPNAPARASDVWQGMCPCLCLGMLGHLAAVPLCFPMGLSTWKPWEVVLVRGCPAWLCQWGW